MKHIRGHLRHRNAITINQCTIYFLYSIYVHILYCWYVGISCIKNVMQNLFCWESLNYVICKWNYMYTCFTLLLCNKYRLYMAFFISYPLSARGHVSAREPIWKIICYDMFIIYFNRGNNWFVPKCLVILARIKYMYMYIVIEQENYCFNIQI